MTARESAAMRRLELENEGLRAANAQHIRVYGEQSIELIERRAAMAVAAEVLAQGVTK